MQKLETQQSVCDTYKDKHIITNVDFLTETSRLKPPPSFIQLARAVQRFRSANKDREIIANSEFGASGLNGSEIRKDALHKNIPPPALEGKMLLTFSFLTFEEYNFQLKNIVLFG